MSYYVMKNSEPKNRIFFRLVVKAGSNLEEDDQKGVAHFVEHLAFNGTENFKKQEIIAFLESVGMKFGAGLNAYTSFEETVYMLEIPADNKEILQKALLILHDWACAVSFEDEEVEKEKGVILEEWRSRQQSLSGRQMEKVLPFFLKFVFTIRSSKEWKVMIQSLPPGARRSIMASSVSLRTSSSRLHSIRIA